MNEGGRKLQRLPAGWKKLKRLGVSPIELARCDLIRRLDPSALRDPCRTERLIQELGLNDEGIDEFPEHLHKHCGQGLRIWQFPNQFAPYLAALADLRIDSYLELGIRHGGSFVATVEILERFHPLRFAVGVDIIPCPSLVEYQRINPRARFVCVNTQSDAFRELIDRYDRIDLLFIDSLHEEQQLRAEFENLQEQANIVAFHDISSQTYPGVRKVWEEVKRSGGFVCREFTNQYCADASHMGIGLAIKNERATH